MRSGHRSWRSFAVVSALLMLALLLSACRISVGDITTRTPVPPDAAATSSAGATPGSQGCVPQTRHDDGSSEGQSTYLSPKQLWTLYGIEPLLQQCYTGKGQTVVVKIGRAHV